MKSNSQIQNIKYLKRKAKSLKLEKGISHSEALKIIASECGYSNWKHLIRVNNYEGLEQEKNIKTGSTIVSEFSLKNEVDPYRNLLVGAINTLVLENKISLNSKDSNNQNENGYIFRKLFGHSSLIRWRGIGYHELEISVWWKYDKLNDPMSSYSENFNSTAPLAPKNLYPNFVGTTASCWLERLDGKYIQGYKRKNIFHVYTRRGELKALKEIPRVKPAGYKDSGPFYI